MGHAEPNVLGLASVFLGFGMFAARVSFVVLLWYGDVVCGVGYPGRTIVARNQKRGS